MFMYDILMLLLILMTGHVLWVNNVFIDVSFRRNHLKLGKLQC